MPNQTSMKALLGFIEDSLEYKKGCLRSLCETQIKRKYWEHL